MTPEEIHGMYIGHAMARDVIAENMPTEWTGLDPQDAEQIPEFMDYGKVEEFAKATFLSDIEGLDEEDRP